MKDNGRSHKFHNWTSMGKSTYLGRTKISIHSHRPAGTDQQYFFIAALPTNNDKFSLTDDDEDDAASSEEEENTSNRSNPALTHQRKNKKRGGNWKKNLSAFTMRLGSVGRMEEGNM
jgi:hypothetical protein